MLDRFANLSGDELALLQQASAVLAKVATK
jgi:hypothetical protein